jgi:hypothetical protein
LVALGWAFARGEARLYLVFVVPVIVGTAPLAFLGILLVFLGFTLTFFFWPFAFAPSSHPLIEPPAILREVPPQDPQMTRRMLILGAILFFALLILTIAIFFV